MCIYCITHRKICQGGFGNGEHGRGYPASEEYIIPLVKEEGRLFQLDLAGKEIEVFPVSHQREVSRLDPWQEEYLRKYALTCIDSEGIVERTDWVRLKKLVNESSDLSPAPATAVENYRIKAMIGLWEAKQYGLSVDQRLVQYRMATIGYVYGNKWCCRFFEVSGRLVRNAATVYHRPASATKEDLVKLWSLYAGEKGIQVSNLDRQARAAKYIIEGSLIWPESEAV